jgi:hypothetical protein
MSVASQGRRLAGLVKAHEGADSAQREASAALRFLLEHGARRQILAAVPGNLPQFNWDSVSARGDQRDSVATLILAGAGLRYVPEYSYSNGYVYLNARKSSTLPISGYEWLLNVSGRDTAPQLAGADSVRVRFDSSSGIALVRIGRDSLVFPLGRLVGTLMETTDVRRYDVPAERLRIDAVSPGRRGTLMVQHIDGKRTGSTVRVGDWNGMLLLGR